MEPVTDRDFKDACHLMKVADLTMAEGADKFVQDVAQAIANGRRESMENRERELARKIHEAQQWYQRIIEPWIKELSDIEMCKPPKPITLADGRVARYIGPLPTWEPDGLRMDQFSQLPNK